jgi:hypothetical protein
MHALRRFVPHALLLLIAVKGAAILCASLAEQAVRLWRLLRHGLAMQDPGCPMAYCDFSVFWLAGRLGNHPATIYNAPAFFTAAARILPHQPANLPFMYPPPILPLTFLMSLPSLAAGYYTFTILSVSLAIFLLRRAELPWLPIAAGLLGPAGLWCVYLGQFGIICAALLIAGLAQLDAKPRTGGGLLAILCIKPQYALLPPVIILARRNGALIGAATMFFCLCALSLCFGWQSWAAFLGPAQTQMHLWLQAPFGTNHEVMGTSIFWMARSLGAGLSTAYTLQLLTVLAAGFAAWHLWRDEETGHHNRIALTVLLVLLASPYSHTDDMVGYSIACAMLMRRATPLANAALGLLWLAPAYIAHVAIKFGFLPTPFCVIAALLIGWRPASRAVTFRRDAPVLFGSQNPSHRFR